MKKLTAVLLALVLALSLTAALAQEEVPTLTISTWSANIDTITANVFAPFEEANNCKIVLDLGNNAPRLAKVTENPENYDIVYFSDLYVQKCIEAGVFMPIDQSKIEGLEDLYPFCQDPSNGYGPGYTVTGFGILYDPKAVSEPITSWAQLWNEEVASQLVIPDISMTSGPYMIEVAGKVAGVDPAENEDPAFEKIKELIGMGAGFYANSGDLAAKFEQGEVSVAVCQDFNASTIRGAVEGLEYVIVPAEGTYLGINQVNIVKGSKNVDLAYKFISWLISYDVQYKDALDKVEAPANTKVVLTPEQAEGICYGETVALSGAPNWALYNERNAAWIERYNEEIYQ
ncbi:MAG: ABC transporter substrate-binding protein [Clostridia bacterium]|nr:ABC transporter substrate-binding protein [Clostridia bacterium]MBQ6232733.1 ABC transporter substrate-binding protein [Clostridia bacterium]